MAQAARASFHEQLPLEPTDEFCSVIATADLGIDADLASSLVDSGPLCFLDLEATGLDPATESLIEVGAVLIDKDSTQARVFNTLVNFQGHLSPFIKRLTGIRDEDLRGAPELSAVAAALDAFLGDTPIVAHNAAFERSWLTAHVGARFADQSYLDTLDLFAVAYPDSPNMKLDTFCRRHLARKERHRALDDALDTLRIAVGLLDESRRGDPAAGNALWALRRFFPGSPWCSRLESCAAESAAARRLRADEDRGLAGGPALSSVAFDRGEIAARLGDPEAGAAVLEGYTPRAEQIELMNRVFDTFEGKRGKNVRVCEAGTGIGKTLAYLSVAIPFVRKTAEQVVITTSSKLLQTQLMEKDIPAAARLLGYPDLRFTSIKGRANYLCRARLDDFLDADPMIREESESRALAILAAFSRNAAHGEVDRIPSVLHQMNPQLETYCRDVTSNDASECTRQQCETTSGDCVFRDARKRLEGAEIVVANHDLLLRWPPDYPKLLHLIVDEVHELSERADGAYALTASAVEIAHRLDSLTGDKAKLAHDVDEEMRREAARALDLIKEIGASARELCNVARADWGFRDELPVPLEGPGASWNELIIACGELSGLLDSVARKAAAIAEENEASEAAGAADALLDAAGVLKVSFPKPPSRLVVRFAGLARPNPSSWRLVATPVSPAADFQCEILDHVETLFGTSATVGVGGNLLGSVAGLEFDQTAAGRFEVNDPVESPFDYANHLKVIFISDATDHSRLVSRTVTAIETLARRLDGKTMGLFTSRDRLSRASEQLDERLSPEGISIIAPATGSADPHELVRNFMETERAVLLGARAFWQGVDIAGDACRAVVIEKLPFSVPGDPLSDRRGQLIEQEGGNAFMDYSLPGMLLRLKQMMGRLIRTPTDTGVIVVVEPRSDKRYFKRLEDALPPRTSYSLIPLSELEAAVDEFFSRS